MSLVTPTDVGLVHAIEAHTSVKWTELELEDERVGEIMIQVNTMYRQAEMKLEKEDWGMKREINIRKKKIQQGIDPDQELKNKKKLRRKMKLSQMLLNVLEVHYNIESEHLSRYFILKSECITSAIVLKGG